MKAAFETIVQLKLKHADDGACAVLRLVNYIRRASRMPPGQSQARQVIHAAANGGSENQMVGSHHKRRVQAG